MKFKTVITTILCFSHFLIPEASTSAPISCKAIAYVIDSKDRNYKPGLPICAGQNIPALSKVIITCIYYKNRQYLIEDYKQIKNCETDLALPVLFPDKQPIRNRARGDLSNTLVLLSPSGKYLIDQTSLRFAWLPVKDADKYTIEMIRNEKDLERYITKSNKLSIPVSGNGTVNYIIRVYSSSRLLDSNIYNYFIKSKDSIRLINGYLNRIDNFTIDARTKVTLKISLLTEYNMVDDAIKLLNSHLFKDRQDYKSYLMMGDAQFSIGMINQARESYNRAKIIADSNHDKYFSLKADLRINLIRNDF